MVSLKICTSVPLEARLFCGVQGGAVFPQTGVRSLIATRVKLDEIDDPDPSAQRMAALGVDAGTPRQSR